MMRNLVVTGWEVGFEKIEFTKLLREELGCSLSEAKSLTDAVLGRKRIELSFPDERFNAAVATMSKIGAVFHEEGFLDDGDLD